MDERKNRRALWCFLILSVGFLAFIFLRSTRTATESNGESHRLTAILLRFFDPAGHYTVGDWNNTVRKLAHFAEYAVLGVLVSGFTGALGRLREQRLASMPLLICLLAATCDELIQLFVPGRGGSPKDILLDFAGVVAGCAVMFFLQSRRKRRNGK